MNNKVLIIPDIHGLDFWEKPCKEWDGIIIFLGDYTDPYPPTSNEESLKNLKKLVEFNKTTKCTCRFLLGNHDYSYLTDFAPYRMDNNHKEEIKSLLNELNLTICTYINTSKVTYLFSHAGITNGWMQGFDYTSTPMVIPNGFIDNKFIKNKLERIPYSRGGNYNFGSCIWNSLSDFEYENHKNDSLSNTYQIFGHTLTNRPEPIINEDFAMLNCHQSFVLNIDTKEITKFDEL